MPKDLQLLGFGRNAKTVKSDKLGDYITGYLYLAPGNRAGKDYEVCPSRSPGCTKGCLYTSGYGDSKHVQQSRIAKTKLFFEKRDEFLRMMYQDIYKLEKKAQKLGKKLAVRLNMTSDIEWEKIYINDIDYSYRVFGNIMEMFPDVQFYDYTKIPKRYKLPYNYHLTFSMDETNASVCAVEMKNGKNVCVVFESAKLPTVFMQKRVINGDAHDLRFLDPRSVIIGVKAKADAKSDDTGFVQRIG